MLLIANASAIYFAPSSPISFNYKCWISVKCLIVVLNKKSHPQIQWCQCVVGFQCFCHVLCSFSSNFIVLWMSIFYQTCIQLWLFNNKQISPSNPILSMCCWFSMLLPSFSLLQLRFYSPENVQFQSSSLSGKVVSKNKQISPSNPMLSMCCW